MSAAILCNLSSSPVVPGTGRNAAGLVEPAGEPGQLHDTDRAEVMTRARTAIVALSLMTIVSCSGPARRPLAIGSPAPEFSLPGVDGATHTLAEYRSSPILVLVAACNHCPASQLYENRIKQLDEDYRAKGVALVAFSPDHPPALTLSQLAYSDVGDTLADMKARASYRGYRFPYLYDGDEQVLSNRLGVVAAPHIFVFDRQRTLQYEGRIDDNLREPDVTSRDARNAIDALLAGRRVPVSRTTPAGCQVAWRTAGQSRQEELAKIEAEPVKLEMVGEERLKALRGNGTGKLLMVNFWATWCGPCVTEFPELEATYRMYRGRGFDFVSVSANDPDDKPLVVAFLQKQHASGPNLQFGTPDTFGLQAAFDPLMPAAVPFTVLIAPNGDIVYQELGELNILRLRRAILANLPDDTTHPGQQAYWSGH
jgi:thiol-disulfide isomerase/thioredoxin